MQLIAKLSDMIEEELNDAEKYAKCALNYKDEGMTALSATFNKLSLEEMGHVNALHEQVTNLITEYRKEHGDPPEKMQGIYEYLHKKHIDHANKIKILQGLYKS